LTGGITFELIEGGGQDQPPAPHARSKPSQKKKYRDKPGRPAGPPIRSRKSRKRR
jgi:hypothetical protein